MLHFPAFICQQVVIVVAPKKGVRACGIGLFIICPLFLRGEIEIAEGYLPIIGNRNVEVIQRVEYLVIHTADTVRNIAAAFQKNTVKPACFLLQLIRQFVGQFLCFLLGNEAGSLYAVNQELEFLCFKLPPYNSPSSCPPIILGFITVFIQKVEVRTDGFLLNGNFVVIVEMVNDFLNLYGVRFVCLFQQIVQKIEKLQPLVL